MTRMTGIRIWLYTNDLRFYIRVWSCDYHHGPNQFEKKSLYLPSHSDHSSWWREDKAGTQGSNLEIGTEEGYGWIFLPDLLPKAYIAYFLIQPMIICPSLALATVGWVLLNQFLIKKIFKDMSICQCDEDSFSIYIPTFQLILDCVDKTNQQNQSIKQTNKTKVIQPLHPFLWLYYWSHLVLIWTFYLYGEQQIRYPYTNFYGFIIYCFCLCKYLLENQDQ